MIEINQKLILELLDKALGSSRLRQNYDLRTGSGDGGAENAECSYARNGCPDPQTPE